MALSEDEAPKVPGRIRAALEHLKLRGIKENIASTLIWANEHTS
jgi:hypothetical protein